MEFSFTKLIKFDIIDTHITVGGVCLEDIVGK